MSDATRRNKLYLYLIGITLQCKIFTSKNLKIIVVVVVCGGHVGLMPQSVCGGRKTAL